jgi:hypothetical protein
VPERTKNELEVTPNPQHNRTETKNKILSNVLKHLKTTATTNHLRLLHVAKPMFTFNHPSSVILNGTSRRSTLAEMAEKPKRLWILRKGPMLAKKFGVRAEVSNTLQSQGCVQAVNIARFPSACNLTQIVRLQMYREVALHRCDHIRKLSPTPIKHVWRGILG